MAFGSNLGNRRENIERALAELAEHCEIVAQSSIHETRPEGLRDQRDFLNGVVLVRTELPPERLLQLCKRIEQRLGRARGPRNGPRPIDLDVLFYADRILVRPGLRIPHPRLHRRRFVLEPLCEIAPDQLHPLLRQSARELLSKLSKL